MDSSLKDMLKTVYVEYVLVVPKWRLEHATEYTNACQGMFDEVLNAWSALKNEKRYNNEEATLEIRETQQNGNNSVYILMRKDRIDVVRA
ncbi:hypothetical protein GIB64_27345 [Pseudomonas lactis]|uniref:hypothetical protein n=1 Tax=Bacteria TaxID=2 RepID=UPI000BB63FC4|nr:MULTISPECIES: hypothetical protein [Bacteria]MBA5961153.1 hypothetical protein [Pseudomonas lactis]MCD3322039.1 hypothetical protein [Clostridium botulinum D/C]PRW70222.1 hypothetical protein C7A12_29535 [Pseudomonas fluorescens]PRW71335.1 hypothetical protein C7A13_29780 [Pseudomonas fluorescens]